MFPPSLHHQAHVKSQHERHRYRFARIAEVVSDLFEDSATDTIGGHSYRVYVSCQGSKSEIHFRKEGGAIEGREGGRLRIAFKYLFSATRVVEFSRRLSNKWSKVEVIPTSSLGQILPRTTTGNSAPGKREFPSKFRNCSRKFASGTGDRARSGQISDRFDGSYALSERSTFARNCYI